MKARSILTAAALLAAALFILDVPAYATDYTWVGGPGANGRDWSKQSNWNPNNNGYPDDAGDTATIGNQQYSPILNDASITELGTITINDGGELAQNSAVTGANGLGTLTVNSGGLLVMGADLRVTSSATIGGQVRTGTNPLTITASGGLTINADGLLNVDGAGTVYLSGGGTHYIYGTLQLSVSDSTLQITDSDVTLDGTGYVEGWDDEAQILITDGETLTNQITIQGALVIDQVSGSATFLNHGLVHANGTSAGSVLNVATATIGDNAGNRWQVSEPNAVLRFSSAATGLVGRFDVDNGTLDIKANVTTTGVLDFQGGKIEVASSTTFQAS